MTATYYTKIEEGQAQAMTAKFVINDGGKWDETNSRMHCCKVIYRDTRYIQQSITKWALTIKDAYDAAVAAWLSEKEAGRAL